MDIVWTGDRAYPELWIDGRMRGYVEVCTCLAFWNYTPSSASGARAFSTVAYPGFADVEAAKTALLDHVTALDARCDGRRGIPGKHAGCSPERCAPGRREVSA